MLVLVVDTATPAVTAAVAEVTPTGVVVRAERVRVGARAHAESLVPQIDAVLTEVGAGPGDLAAVVAGVGPGPYTGLRVGLVTAAGLGDALAIPTYGVGSLDAVGAAAGAGRVLAATDARRREIYWGLYTDGVPLAEPAVGRPADVAASVAGRVDRAVGEGASRYADVLGLPVAPEPRYPPAWALATLAAERVLATAPSERLVPLYLRRPDATEPGARKPVLS